MARIELINVSKRYGTVTAVDDVALTVEDGEFLTLLGPSGCGKSTTLNMIAGLEEVSEGRIEMDGTVVNDLTPFERDVAMVFQSYGLYPHMTVGENIGFTLRLRKIPKKKIRERVAAVAEALELEPLLDRLPRELSGGQQQRVALGRAIIREPKVFLFDEPFSNLDAALRFKMRTEIKELHEKLGITSVFVTHDQEEALSLSDRIAILGQGRIQQIGTPEEVYYRPANTYVARFIGSPQMELLPGSVERTDDGPGFRIGETAFPLTEGIAAALPSEEIAMGVRPENVIFSDDGIPVRVRMTQPIGPFTDVSLEWEGGTFVSRVPGFVEHRIGEEVRIRIDPRGYNWFDLGTGERILA